MPGGLHRAAATGTALKPAYSAAGAAQLKLSAMVHGLSIAYWIAAGLLTLAALAAGTLINARPQRGGGHSAGPDGIGTESTETVEDAVPVFAH